MMSCHFTVKTPWSWLLVVLGFIYPFQLESADMDNTINKIILKEGEAKTMGEHIVDWRSTRFGDDDMMAELTLMKQRDGARGKPISGGYVEGATITIGGTDYFITNLEKFGVNQAGTLQLSRTRQPLPNNDTPIPESLTLERQKTVLIAGNYLTLTGFNDDENDQGTCVQIQAVYTNQKKDQVTIEENTVLWLGKFAMRVEKMGSNGTATLKKISDLNMVNQPVISGERINAPSNNTEMNPSAHQFIRYLSGGHCSKGQKVCAKCQQAAQNSNYFLLKVASAAGGKMARPVIEMTVAGKKIRTAYDIVKKFKHRQEALEYAQNHDIVDVIIP